MEEGMSEFFISGVSVGGNSGSATTGTKCGRWNPTTEQVKVLTELFSSGLRTPSTDQIQKISNQLSFYGKIESKNVFYWFQNHKARERQKRRKLYQVSEPERVIETLQLFPLNSFGESESKNMRVHASDQCRDSTMFSYTVGEQMDHPPLDLRLSFM
ncbi:hypothetical protein JHK87_032036 [Glycine soja]|nr:hypothetical protein JHK87_032036 [Glycine soja]